MAVKIFIFCGHTNLLPRLSQVRGMSGIIQSGMPPQLSKLLGFLNLGYGELSFDLLKIKFHLVTRLD
jgi:hypothetical protein